MTDAESTVNADEGIRRRNIEYYGARLVIELGT